MNGGVLQYSYLPCWYCYLKRGSYSIVFIIDEPRKIERSSVRREERLPDRHDIIISQIPLTCPCDDPFVRTLSSLFW